MMGRARFCVAGVALALFALGGCRAPETLLGCEPRGGLHPHCEFQNPEDLLALSHGWLLVSQGLREDTPGSLVAFHPERDERRTLWPDRAARAAAQRGVREDPAVRGASPEACTNAPNALFFAPHGIARSADGTQVYVINHGGGEAVEFFELSESASAPPALRWRGCTLVPARFDAMLNDLAGLPDGGFVTTKMSSANPVRSFLQMLRKMESGELLRWSPPSAPQPGWRVVPNSAGVAPNGVAASADGAHFYFSEWMGQRLVRVAADGSARRSAPLDFAPDNITWESADTLLLAGQHARLPEAVGCILVGAESKPGACGLASSVVRVNAQTLAVERVLRHDPPTVLGAASVALAVGDKLWMGTFSGDRLVWMAR